MPAPEKSGDAKYKWLFEDQGIDQLPVAVQEKFKKLYYASTSITAHQDCNIFYEQQLRAAGNGDVVDGIYKAKGNSIIEKIDNYAAANPDKIQVTQDLYQGQQWANDENAYDVAMVDTISMGKKERRQAIIL